VGSYSFLYNHTIVQQQQQQNQPNKSMAFEHVSNING